jgi:hypothetical protein
MIYEWSFLIYKLSFFICQALNGSYKLYCIVLLSGYFLKL